MNPGITRSTSATPAPQYDSALSGATSDQSQQVVQFLVQMANMAGSMVMGGASGGLSSLGGVGSSLTEYQNLINTQIQEQRLALAFNFQSNMLKLQHDTNMNTVRNIRP